MYLLQISMHVCLALSKLIQLIFKLLKNNMIHFYQQRTNFYSSFLWSLTHDKYVSWFLNEKDAQQKRKNNQVILKEGSLRSSPHSSLMAKSVLFWDKTLLLLLWCCCPQKYCIFKWVSLILMFRGKPAMDYRSIQCRGGREIPLVTLCYRNQDN